MDLVSQKAGGHLGCSFLVVAKLLFRKGHWIAFLPQVNDIFPVITNFQIFAKFPFTDYKWGWMFVHMLIGWLYSFVNSLFMSFVRFLYWGVFLFWQFFKGFVLIKTLGWKRWKQAWARTGKDGVCQQKGDKEWTLGFISAEAGHPSLQNPVTCPCLHSWRSHGLTPVLFSCCCLILLPQIVFTSCLSCRWPSMVTSPSPPI